MRGFSLPGAAVVAMRIPLAAVASTAAAISTAAAAFATLAFLDGAGLPLRNG